MVDNRALAAAGDHDDLLDSARDCLFDAVLDRRLVDERQHLLRLRFGDRQEARAKTRGGKNRPAHPRHWRQSLGGAPSKVFGRATKDAPSAVAEATLSPPPRAAKAPS